MPMRCASRTARPPATTGRQVSRRRSRGSIITCWGRPLDPSLAAPVHIYVMGEHVWRAEQEWPLARTRYVSYYLRAAGSDLNASGGRLTTERPEAPEPAASWIYDPRHPVPSRGGAMLGPRAGIERQNDVEARRDVLVYSTAPLASDLEVTGPVSAELYVATTAPNTDFTVKLVDVHEDDSAYNVSDGIVRRDYVPGSRSSPTRITIELWPTSMLFRRGHRIRIEVSSSNYPRYDRNPNTGGDIAFEASPLTATQTVFHGAKTLSRIILPVIPQ